MITQLANIYNPLRDYDPKLGMYGTKPDQLLSAHDMLRIGHYRIANNIKAGRYYDVYPYLKYIDEYYGIDAFTNQYSRANLEQVTNLVSWRARLAAQLGGKTRLSPYHLFNCFSLASRKFAQLTHGKPAVIKSENEAEQPVIDELVDLLKFGQVMFSATETACLSGDVLIKLDIQPKEDGTKTIKACLVDPSRWKPLIGEYDTIEKNTLYDCFTMENGKKYIRLETFLPGKNVNKLFELVSENEPIKFGDPVNPESIGYEFQEEVTNIQLTEDGWIEETDCDLPTLFWIPNRIIAGEPTGISDLTASALSHGEELATQLIQLAQVIYTHGNPKMAVGRRATNDGNVLKLSGEAYISVDYKEGESPPSYIQRDLQIEQIYQSINHIVDMIHVEMEISRALTGGQSRSATAESAEKMALEMQTTVLRSLQQQMIQAPIMRDIIYTASQYGAFYGVDSVSALSAKPKVLWQTVIGENKEKVYAREISRFTAGLADAESTLRRIDGYDVSDEEIMAVKAKQQASQQQQAVSGNAASRLRERLNAG